MFVFIETNHSSGYAYHSGTVAELAVRLENGGHVIKKIERIDDEPNSKHTKEFVFNISA